MSELNFAMLAKEISFNEYANISNEVIWGQRIYYLSPGLPLSKKKKKKGRRKRQKQSTYAATFDLFSHFQAGKCADKSLCVCTLIYKVHTQENCNKRI